MVCRRSLRRAADAVRLVNAAHPAKPARKNSALRESLPVQSPVCALYRSGLRFASSSTPATLFHLRIWPPSAGSRTVSALLLTCGRSAPAQAGATLSLLPPAGAPLRFSPRPGAAAATPCLPPLSTLCTVALAVPGSHRRVTAAPPVVCHAERKAATRSPVPGLRGTPRKTGVTPRPSLFPLRLVGSFPACPDGRAGPRRSASGRSPGGSLLPLSRSGRGSRRGAGAHPLHIQSAPRRAGAPPEYRPCRGSGERSAPPLTRLRSASTLARPHRCDLLATPQRLPACPPAGMRGGGHSVARKAAFPASGRRGRSLLLLWP